MDCPFDRAIDPRFIVSSSVRPCLTYMLKDQLTPAQRGTPPSEWV
jgi:hypothetical protein